MEKKELKTLIKELNSLLELLKDLLDKTKISDEKPHHKDLPFYQYNLTDTYTSTSNEVLIDKFKIKRVASL